MDTPRPTPEVVQGWLTSFRTLPPGPGRDAACACVLALLATVADRTALHRMVREAASALDVLANDNMVSEASSAHATRVATAIRRGLKEIYGAPVPTGERTHG